MGNILKGGEGWTSLKDQIREKGNTKERDIE